MCCVVANETCVVRSRPSGNIYSIHRLSKTQLGFRGMPKIRPLATANRVPTRQFWYSWRAEKHVTLVYRIWIVMHAHVVSSSISASHSRRILCVYLPPGGFAMASPFVHFTEKEVQLLTRWRAEGKSVGEIASLLQRDETTIRRQMKRARGRGVCVDLSACRVK